jgi:pyruvate,water dikinase
MQSFNDGDILVTPMTTPDVMYAIERASAIVTDEGGVLCHAAIISRELNKPCVIGCGVATRAFRDGDRVTVQADARGGTVTLVTDP